MNMLLQKLKALYHRYPLITSLSVLILFGATLTFATPPVSPYTPGETLDPSCAPGDANCTVTIIPDQTGNSGKYLTTDGTTASWAMLSGSGISSLNGLAGATQTFAVGTSGTDFNIDSTGTTHTFNIPTASGSARGLLSSADWTTFNGKENALTFSGPLSRSVDTISIAQSDTSTDGYLSSTDWNTFNDKVSSPISVGTSGSTLYTPGFGAGQGDTVNGNNIFFGQNAGSNATNTSFSNFIGFGAGQNVTDASASNFLGINAGSTATNAINSNFFGVAAGSGATNASDSNFFGQGAGQNAANTAYSNFLGYAAGSGATNAANSIFIGKSSGTGDTVNNTVSGWSILVGNNTSTGGFSNSIALGANAINTATDQFALADSITKMKLSGVEYTLPSAQAGGAGYVLSNDGSGGLSWAVDGSQWITSGSDIYYDTGTVGIGMTPTTASLAVNGRSYFQNAYNSLFIDGGVYSSESGLYSAAGNEQIATYDTGSGFYYYGNGALFVNGDNTGFGTSGSPFTPDARVDALSGGPAGAVIGKLGFNSGNISYGVYGSSDGGTGATGLGVWDDNTASLYGVYSSDASAKNYFAGNTQIGDDITGAAVSKLTIGGNIGLRPSDRICFDGDCFSSIFNNQNDSLGNGIQSLVISSQYGQGISFRQNEDGTTYMYLDGTGALGLGNGDTVPDASSILDLTSTTRGFLAPRMSETDRDAIASPATGLQIYNTDTNALNIYDGSAWGAIGGGGSSPVALGTSGTTLYTPSLGAEEGDLATGNNIFFGPTAGFGANNAVNSNFLGYSAGFGATDVGYSNFLGYNVGTNATNVSYSNFFGFNAGASAANASYSNFLGANAGQDAINATTSNFLGYSAGSSATNAANSVFLGINAGYQDTVNNTGGSGFDDSSILIGNFTNTGGFSNSILLGSGTPGVPIANTKVNQFMLADTITDVRWSGVEYTLPSAQAVSGGYVLTNDGSGGLSWGAVSSPTSPIILGTSGNTLYTPGLGSGEGDTVTGNNIFFGTNAGANASNAAYSNFFGFNAGYSATNAVNSNFFGNNAGNTATDAGQSNFFGNNAGNTATNASNSNFFSENAGSSATNAAYSNFFGFNAGSSATNAAYSNFFGDSAGSSATGASYSNFFGQYAGVEAMNASYSNFLAANAGSYATNASYSNFIGYNAGVNAINAANSIFIGTNAGNEDTVLDNTQNGQDDSSILIGNFTNTGGFSNSILLGSGTPGVPIANTKVNQFMLADTITDVRWSGVEYTLPSAQAGGAGYVLSNDGSGALSWVAAGGGSSLQLFNENMTSYDNSLYGPLVATGVGGVVVGSMNINIYDSTTAGATGDYATALGFNALASGFHAVAIGTGGDDGSALVTASGTGSVALGSYALSSGVRSFAVNGTASGEYSLALKGTASGDYSIALGGEALGQSSVAIGDGAVAYSNREVAIGDGAVYTPINDDSDRFFNVGYDGSNRFTILKNGETTIGGNLAGINGVSYIWPSSQAAGVDYVLTNDGSGNLTWAAQIGGGGGGGIISLNGLSGATQTFSTGTSGSDFDISSSGTIHTFNIPTASGSARGLLSSTDWTTFNSKENTLTFSGPLSRSVNAISIASANGSQNGYLSSGDWTTFNSKQSALTIGNLTSSTTGLSVSGGTSAVIGSGVALSIADAVANGSTKGISTFTAADFNAASGVISIDYSNGQAASGSTKGFLTSGDWTTFNNKFNTPSGTTSQYIRGDGTLATLSADGKLSSLIAATATNSIDNLNFSQTWDWSTASIENPFSMNFNGLTSGVGFSLASSSTSLTTGMLGKFELTGNYATGNPEGLRIGLTNTSATGASTALNITNGGNNSNAFALRVNDDGTYTDTTPFIINGLGNVGIGTTTPVVQLDIPIKLPTASTGSVAMTGFNSGLTVQGNYLYAVGSDNTLQIFNITNPAAPASVGSVSTTNAMSGGLVVSNGYVYGLTTSLLKVINVSNPASPSVVYTSGVLGFSPTDIKVQGRYLYVASATTFRVFDISNPASPVSVASVSTTGANVSKIAIEGRYAYVSSTSALQTFDISNPVSPTSVGSISVTTIAIALEVQGNYLYALRSGGVFEIYNISNPTTPVSVGTLSITGGSSLSVQGRYAYIGRGSSGVLVLDVSNPASPTSVGTVSAGTGENNYIAVQGRYVYTHSYNVSVTNSTIETLDFGGSYAQHFESGVGNMGSLNVRNNLTAVTGVFSGGVDIGNSLNVFGGVNINSTNTTSNIFSINASSTSNTLVSAFSTAATGATTDIMTLQYRGLATVATTNKFLRFTNSAGTTQGQISGTGVAGNVLYTTTSDARLKHDIVDTHLGLDDIMQIGIKDYVFNADTSNTLQTGILAQDLYKIYPQAVATNGDDGTGLLTTDANPWQIDYGKLTPLIIRGVQELNLKLTSVEKFSFEDTGGFAERLREFFESTTNGIRTIFVKEVQTDKLCVGTTCVTESQLQQLLNQSGQSGSAPAPSPEPEVTTTEGDTPEETIPSEGSVPQEEIAPDPAPEPIPETVPEPAPEVVTQSEPPVPTE